MQTNWTKEVWSITCEPEFTQISAKSNDAILKNIAKLYFWIIFDNFQSFFTHIDYIGDPILTANTMVNFRKKLMGQFKENFWTNRMTERWKMDRPKFIGHIQSQLGVEKKRSRKMFFPLEIVSIFLVICSSTFNNEINLNVNKALNISRVKFSYLNKPN